MHAQLSDKKIGPFELPFLCTGTHRPFSVCKEFIEALQKCHATGWNRFIGTCNVQKDELNDCLRAEVSMVGILSPHWKLNSQPRTASGSDD